MEKKFKKKSNSILAVQYYKYRHNERLGRAQRIQFSLIVNT